MIPSLAILRKVDRSTDELWVLRLLRDSQFLELDWSAVTQSGDWKKTPAPDAPAGLQVTRFGSMRFHTHGRAGVDLMWGPFCGVCEIVHHGRVHTLNLRRPEVGIRRVWLDELDSESQSRPGGGGWADPTAAAGALRPEHADLETAEIALIAVAPPTASIAPMLGLRPECRVLNPEELGLPAVSSSIRSIAYALRVLENTDCRRMAIDTAVLGGVELADHLLRAESDTHIIALLGETAPLGTAGAYAAYRSPGPWSSSCYWAASRPLPKLCS